MNPIAIYSGSLVIYWSAMVIALGIAAGFFLSLSLHLSDGGRASAMWVFLPIATVLSVFFSRLMHWYCHLEQYGGFVAAMTDYSVGAFCLAGVLLGVSLGAWIVKLMGLCETRGELLDAVAPGLSLTIALVRLSALFNSSCRSNQFQGASAPADRLGADERVGGRGVPFCNLLCAVHPYDDRHDPACPLLGETAQLPHEGE